MAHGVLGVLGADDDGDVAGNGPVEGDKPGQAVLVEDIEEVEHDLRLGELGLAEDVAQAVQVGGLVGGLVLYLEDANDSLGDLVLEGG